MYEPFSITKNEMILYIDDRLGNHFTPIAEQTVPESIYEDLRILIARSPKLRSISPSPFTNTIFLHLAQVVWNEYISSFPQISDVSTIFVSQ